MKPATLLLLCLLPQLAFAARPLVTDDARLTTAGSCQLESWVRSNRDSREAWALPACNPTGNLELTLGGGRARSDGAPGTEDYVFQAKTLFRPLATNDWGWGLTLGTVRHPREYPGPNLLGNSYVTLPLSVSFDDDNVVLHANVGWLRERASGRRHLTWGTGGEFRLTERLSGIAEAFGDDRNKPYGQIGGRVQIVPDLIQVDATVGRQFAGPADSRWISLGLRLTPDRLF